MNTRLLSFLSVLLGGVLAASSHAQVYIDLPIGSWANDVTPDGTVVVGTWEGIDGFIWRWQEDAEPTIVLGGDIVAVSDDGAVVAGNYFEPSVNTTIAGRWTEATGWEPLGFFGPPCGTSYSSAYDISGDGNRIIGLGWNGCTALGFIWENGVGMQQLQLLANGTNRATAISGDGTAIGGFAQGSFTRTPAYWADNGGGFVIDANFDGEVFGFNEDGSQSVGTLRVSGQNYHAYIREAGTGAINDLGTLNATWNGNATDISEDGNTVVGYDVTGLAREAWMWTPASGIVALDDVISFLGLTADPALVCRAVSDDGNIIVGGGLDGSGGPFGFGGFILALEDPTWLYAGDGLAGTGGLTPKLAGSGTLIPGELFSLTLSNALPSTQSYLFAGLSELGAPFKGGVMVPALDFIVGPQNTNASGELTLAFPWPPGAPSGFAAWWQRWNVDPAGPVGVSASNALKSTTP